MSQYSRMSPLLSKFTTITLNVVIINIASFSCIHAFSHSQAASAASRKPQAAIQHDEGHAINPPLTHLLRDQVWLHPFQASTGHLLHVIHIVFARVAISVPGRDVPRVPTRMPKEMCFRDNVEHHRALGCIRLRQIRQYLQIPLANDKARVRNRWRELVHILVVQEQILQCHGVSEQRLHSLVLWVSRCHLLCPNCQQRTSKGFEFNCFAFQLGERGCRCAGFHEHVQRQASESVGVLVKLPHAVPNGCDILLRCAFASSVLIQFHRLSVHSCMMSCNLHPIGVVRVGSRRTNRSNMP